MSPQSSPIQLLLSNRLEDLSLELVNRLDKPKSDPFSPDTVLVQSRGMARWLSLQTAQIKGIQMNTEYLFPKVLIERLMGSVLKIKDSDTTDQAFSRESLMWQLFFLLPALSEENAQTDILNYLQKSGKKAEEIRCFQLSQKLANYFDQLQVYRPELLSDSTNGEYRNDWKLLAWATLKEKLPKLRTFGDLYDQFAEQLTLLIAPPKDWPDTIHIFGISFLPPVYLKIIQKLSKHIRFNIYLTQPSPYYWGDIVSKKQRLKEDNNVESEGHPLLGSLGKQGQEFINLLTDIDIYSNDQTESFFPPARDNLLKRVQEDLYSVTPPQIIDKPDIGEEDPHLEFHSCHGSLREIEVLYNRLLGAFNLDPSLNPDEVIVMAPDINQYLPHIYQVFGNPEQASLKVPFSISDSAPTTNNQGVEAFLSLFDLLQGKFGVNEVLDFLARPQISERFNLTEDDRDQLKEWFTDAGIRWGVDSDHRSKFCDPSFEAYSWKQGIEKMLLGYCSDPSIDYPGVPDPLTDIEGNISELLNRFLEVWEFLERLLNKWQHSHLPEYWIFEIRSAAAFLFNQNTEQEAEFQLISNALEELMEDLDQVTDPAPVSIDVIRDVLICKLGDDTRVGSYFSGRVTFCSLKPMRNIPARFIALIGMNETDYPRKEIRTEFNTFPDGNRLGDRSLKDDDRLLFLETLLSVRERLYISYTGINARDLSERPASIIVEELLDTLDDYYKFPKKSSARKHLICKERLQAFNANYYSRLDPESYSDENLRAAQTLQKDISDPIDFNENLPPQTVEKPDTLSIDSLTRFFKNPSQNWLNLNLGIRYPDTKSSLKDTEPIIPSGLERYQLASHAIAESLNLPNQNFKPSTSMPVGESGKLIYDQIVSASKPFVVELNTFIDGKTWKTKSYDLELSGIHISGTFNLLSDNTLLKFRNGKLKAHEKFAAWIEHLFLSCNNSSIRTILVGSDETLQFTHVDHPDQILSSLIQLYLDGQCHPLPLFPKASFIYANAAVNGSKKEPIDLATSEFNKIAGDFSYEDGEWADPYMGLFFKDSATALGPDFEVLATKTYGKMLENLKA